MAFTASMTKEVGYPLGPNRVKFTCSDDNGPGLVVYLPVWMGRKQVDEIAMGLTLAWKDRSHEFAAKTSDGDDDDDVCLGFIMPGLWTRAHMTMPRELKRGTEWEPTQSFRVRFVELVLTHACRAIESVWEVNVDWKLDVEVRHSTKLEDWTGRQLTCELSNMLIFQGRIAEGMTEPEDVDLARRLGQLWIKCEAIARLDYEKSSGILSMTKRGLPGVTGGTVHTYHFCVGGGGDPGVSAFVPRHWDVELSERYIMTAVKLTMEAAKAVVRRTHDTTKGVDNEEPKE